jgi:hypothetical protein
MLKEHKRWFHEEYSRMLDQRKWAKLQWLQNPSQMNENNLHNRRRGWWRHFRKKKGRI